jgi:hypothetical protein
MMPRSIHDHEINPLNKALLITTLAPYIYSVIDKPSGGEDLNKIIRFHIGPLQYDQGQITKKGQISGITNEALVAVVLDRMRELQKTAFSCDENNSVILHLQQALSDMASRTMRRTKNGTEGTHIPDGLPIQSPPPQ